MNQEERDKLEHMRLTAERRIKKFDVLQFRIMLLENLKKAIESDLAAPKTDTGLRSVGLFKDLIQYRSSPEEEKGFLSRANVLSLFADLIRDGGGIDSLSKLIKDEAEDLNPEIK